MAKRTSTAKGLTVAITGPTGEMGQAVVSALERSREVRSILGMARRPFDPASRGWKKVNYRQGDVLDRRRVSALTVSGAPDSAGRHGQAPPVQYRATSGLSPRRSQASPGKSRGRRRL